MTETKERPDTDPQVNGTSLEPFVKTRCGDNEFHCNQGDRYLESVVNIFYKVKKLLGSRFHVARLVAFLPAGCATDRTTAPMEKMRWRLSVKVGKSESRIA